MLQQNSQTPLNINFSYGRSSETPNEAHSGFQNPYYQYIPISFNNARLIDLLDIHLKKILTLELEIEKTITSHLEKAF